MSSEGIEDGALKVLLKLFTSCSKVQSKVVYSAERR